MKQKQLSFYYFGNTIYFNADDGGIPHPDLWRKIVLKAFSGLTYDNKTDLFNHCYGVDRGRVVFREDLGTWVLYGTPGLESIKQTLLEEFDLLNVPYETDFRTDLHYKTVSSDVSAVLHAMKLVNFQYRAELVFAQII